MIGKNKTTELILPVFSNLLKDQDSEVRINLLKKLGDLNKVDKKKEKTMVFFKLYRSLGLKPY